MQCKYLSLLLMLLTIQTSLSEEGGGNLRASWDDPEFFQFRQSLMQLPMPPCDDPAGLAQRMNLINVCLDQELSQLGSVWVRLSSVVSGGDLRGLFPPEVIAINDELQARIAQVLLCRPDFEGLAPVQQAQLINVVVIASFVSYLPKRGHAPLSQQLQAFVLVQQALELTRTVFDRQLLDNPKLEMAVKILAFAVKFYGPFPALADVQPQLLTTNDIVQLQDKLGSWLADKKLPLDFIKKLNGGLPGHRPCVAKEAWDEVGEEGYLAFLFFDPDKMEHEPFVCTAFEKSYLEELSRVIDPAFDGCQARNAAFVYAWALAALSGTEGEILQGEKSFEGLYGLLFILKHFPDLALKTEPAFMKSAYVFLNDLPAIVELMETADTQLDFVQRMMKLYFVANYRNPERMALLSADVQAWLEQLSALGI